jgi:hypothetical protein
MSLTIGEPVIPMTDTIMLFVSQVNKTRVTAPGIGMYDAVRLHSAADNGLQSLSGTVGNDLRIYLSATLKDAENRDFTISAAGHIFL